MIIMIEGKEGTGKTSLANHLSKRFGWPVVHPARYRIPQNNNWREDFAIATVVCDLLPQNGVAILDRGAISGLAYDAVLSDQEVTANISKYFDVYSRHTIYLVHMQARPLVRLERDPSAIPLARDIDAILEHCSKPLHVRYARLNSSDTPTDELAATLLREICIGR